MRSFHVASKPRSRAAVCAVVIASLALIACTGFASFDSSQDPTALIVEQNFTENSSTAELFYVAAIDGIPVESSLQATRKASAGSNRLSLVSVERRIPIRSVRLTIVATRIMATPAEEAASRAAGELWSVEGDVTLDPVAGAEYFIAGELKKAGSSVWVADLKTGQRVSAVVSEHR